MTHRTGKGNLSQKRRTNEKKNLSDSSGCVPLGKQKDYYYFFNFHIGKLAKQCTYYKRRTCDASLRLWISWVVFPIMLLCKPEINLKSKKDIWETRLSWRTADVLWLTRSFQLLLACRRAKPHVCFPMSLAARVGKSLCLYHRQRQWGFTGYNIPWSHTLCTR